MSEERLKKLLKTDVAERTEIKSGEVFKEEKEIINKIYDTLLVESKEYIPFNTIDLINRYISCIDKKKRILYSEINNRIYELGDEECGTIVTNIDNLLKEAYYNEDVTDNCCQIIIKIYDHTNLVVRQKSLSLKSSDELREFFGKSTSESIEVAKKSIKKETDVRIQEIVKNSKKIEKEYITILGIFASIVLAFVGGLTFSSSILQNMHSVSIYRLLVVIDLLALVIVNMIYLLVRFICLINNKKVKSLFPIVLFNIIGGCFFLLTGIAWALNIASVSDFLKQILPWTR